MTLELKNIWESLNKNLSLINAIIWGLITLDGSLLKTAKEKKIPLAFNVVLLLALLCFLVIMTYGSYRRQTS
ncbi:MAG: hypothetical protein Q8L81_12070 [Bacteroidota bacterium]|nr:hypothetical protein [Bacteroidota bacterium]